MASSSGTLHIEEVHARRLTTRWELLSGQLHVLPLRQAVQGALASNLAFFLSAHIKSLALGKVYACGTGFVLDRGPDTLMAPAVAFVRHAPSRTRHLDYVLGAPTLVVEIPAPDDGREQVDPRIARWLTGGADEVWVVWPKTRSVTIHGRSAEVIPLGPNDELVGDPLVPGFKCGVHGIFE